MGGRWGGGGRGGSRAGRGQDHAQVGQGVEDRVWISIDAGSTPHLLSTQT